MINYLALLGWGYDETTTFFTIPQLQELFSLERVSKNPAVFDEQKLRWMNGRYLRELEVEELQDRLEGRHSRELRRDVVEIAQEKISTLDEFWPLAGFFFDGPADDAAAREKVLGADGAQHLLREARGSLESLSTWDPASIEGALREVVEREGVKPKHVFQPVRVALAGATISPGIFETVAVMGRDETLARIDAVLSGSRV